MGDWRLEIGRLEIGDWEIGDWRLGDWRLEIGRLEIGRLEIAPPRNSQSSISDFTEKTAEDAKNEEIYQRKSR